MTACFDLKREIAKLPHTTEHLARARNRLDGCSSALGANIQEISQFTLKICAV